MADKHPEVSDRVIYFVQRKLISETAFTLVSGSGEKSYSDETLSQCQRGPRNLRRHVPER